MEKSKTAATRQLVHRQLVGHTSAGTQRPASSLARPDAPRVARASLPCVLRQAAIPLRPTQQVRPTPLSACRCTLAPRASLSSLSVPPAHPQPASLPCAQVNLVRTLQLTRARRTALEQQRAQLMRELQVEPRRPSPAMASSCCCCGVPTPDAVRRRWRSRMLPLVCPTAARSHRRQSCCRSSRWALPPPPLQTSSSIWQCGDDKTAMHPSAPLVTRNGR